MKNSKKYPNLGATKAQTPIERKTLKTLTTKSDQNGHDAKSANRTENPHPTAKATPEATPAQPSACIDVIVVLVRRGPHGPPNQNPRRGQHFHNHIACGLGEGSKKLCTPTPLVHRPPLYGVCVMRQA